MIFTSRWPLLSQAESIVSLNCWSDDSVLAEDGQTCRDWFLGHSDHHQPQSTDQSLRHILEPAHKLITTTMKTRPVNCSNSLLVVIVRVTSLTFRVLYIIIPITQLGQASRVPSIIAVSFILWAVCAKGCVWHTINYIYTLKIVFSVFSSKEIIIIPQGMIINQEYSYNRGLKMVVLATQL